MKKIPPYERGVGRFQMGQRVTWSARAGHHNTGTIVQIVGYADYPRVCPNEAAILKKRPLWPSDTVWKELVHHGYWREHESYVVLDERGKRWWPRVGNLHPIPMDKEND